MLSRRLSPCYFDISKPLILACDASPYGVGAVLLHQVGEDDLPIAFTSHSLAPAEKNYSQIDRGISHSIWSKTFSSVFVWAVLYDQVRS